jgi:PhnB protein
MMTPQFYLFFNGDCLEAMTLYAETLGGRIDKVFLNKDAPPDQRMPGGDDLVMNLDLWIGDTLMLASDNSDEMYERPQGFRIQIETPSADDFDRVFAALSKDARDMPMPPGETFWAQRFAMFTDRYGTPWMLNFTGSKSPDATA